MDLRVKYRVKYKNTYGANNDQIDTTSSNMDIHILQSRINKYKKYRPLLRKISVHRDVSLYNFGFYWKLPDSAELVDFFIEKVGTGINMLHWTSLY